MQSDPAKNDNVDLGGSTTDPGNIEPPKHSKRALVAAVGLFLGVVGVTTISLLVFNEDVNAPHTEQTKQTQTSQSQQDSSTQSEISTDALSAGVAAKQAEFEAANPEYPDAEKIVYEISNDGSSEPELHPADAELWDMVRTLAPTDEVFRSITQFEVYFDEDDTTLASVESLDDTNSTWLYSINYIAVVEFEELVPTIVHEFAHILALQNDQTTTETETAGITTTCQNLLVIEGCLNSSSFLDAFYQTFWKDTDADLGDVDRDEDEALVFFEQNEDSFVSDYATTNVVEDFAESFMYYAVKDPMDQATTAAQKVNFFADYDSLKVYRQNVRQEIAAWAHNTTQSVCLEGEVCEAY